MRIISIILISAFTILLSGCGFFQNDKEATKEAVTLYNQGEFKQSQKILLDLYDKEPTITQSYYLGKTSMKVGDYQQALVGFQDLIEQQPTDENYADLGLAYYYNGDFSQAENAFNTAIRKNPENFKALMNKGVLLADSGKLEMSLKYFEAAEDVQPENLALLYNKATVLSDLSYQEKIAGTAGFAIYGRKALDLFNEVLEKDPEMTEAYIFKGITYYDIENYDKALEFIEEALKRDPDNINALYYKAKTHTALDNPKGAISIFEEILEIDPSNLQAIQEIRDLRSEYNLLEDNGNE